MQAPRSLTVPLLVLLALSDAPVARGERPGAARPVGLRCEDANDPIGVETGQPRLSWLLAARGWDQRQTAYQILVASSPTLLAPDRADLWDSGQVWSANSVHVPYGGVPLPSRQVCHWKVRVWDGQGRVSAWSERALWEMALLRPEDWSATWIGAGPAMEPRPPAGFFKSRQELTNLNLQVAVESRSTLLRKEFHLDRPLRRARAYVTGLGYYEFSINGQRVGRHVLTPAKSNYRKWVDYDIHDVTSHLRRGRNALGLHLGNGWFNPALKWWEPYRMQWFGSKRALLQLHLDYQDGSSALVESDPSWRTAPGPVLSSCVFDGELYDATAEHPGWDQPGFDDRRWQAAHGVEPPGGQLLAALMPPIRVVEHRTPFSLSQPRPGVSVFDLGQNVAGWARLTARGPRGTRVTLRYAEDLGPDGMLDVTSNERAQATDTYVLRGDGRETYEPRFTFHGFRYVEVTGLPKPPRRDDVLGCVVHTDAASPGDFDCDHPLINRIHRATHWSQRSNLMGYPMDCPQRDERLGWFGDALVSMEEAMFNFDLPLFYRHWLNGVRANQNEADGDISIVSPRPYLPEEPDPTWSSAYLLMVWQYYVHYGDRRFLAAHFDAMRRYVDYLGTQATHHILPQYWIGDWGTIVEGWKEGEPASVGTAFYYLDARTVAAAARVLGRPAEAAHYETLARAIRAAFHRRFYDPARQHYNRGTQFSNALPLAFGMAELNEQPALLDHILRDLDRRQGRFNVGVLGAKYLLDALTQQGRADVAFALATQTGYPSWGHMLEGGRTTLSEFWNLRGSHNHVMMGSVDGWFYRVLGGIQADPDRPGFEHVTLRPFVPEGLNRVRASILTLRGRVAVHWRKQPGGLTLEATVPPNTTATVHVPAPAEARITSTPPREPARREAAAAIFEVGSGRYVFSVRMPQAKGSR